MNAHNLRVRQVVMAMVALLVGLVGPLTSVASAQGNSNSDLNQTSYYEGLGYGTCQKIDNPPDPYTLPAPPSGTYWSLLVLKAGSAQSNDDWNTLIPNPTPGQYVHPSGKTLSHVIFCYKSGTGPTTTTSSTTTTTTTPGGGCGEYTPTGLAINRPTVQAGDTIIVTGNAVPGATVTMTISTGSGPVTLGSAVAGPSGTFSITAVVPASTNPGTYTLTLTSNQCPASGTITLTVASPHFSGCGYNNAGRTFYKGESAVWYLHSPSFNTSAPVKLRIYKTGSNYQLFNGPWPANDAAAITIPAGAPTGNYTMEQEGTKPNGKVMTKTCPITVVLNSVMANSNAAPSSAQGGGGSALTANGLSFMLAAGALGLLVRLRTKRFA